VVASSFNTFAQVYPERYQKSYGFLRPAIPASVKKFLKCGDLKEGFARVRCPDCGEEYNPPVPRKCTLAWAALIRLVYEVDPLKCPQCGSTMEIIAFIEKDEVIEKKLRHAGLWRDTPARPPPPATLAA
jgi:DNA-directed RNA polymerase subunit RPC12/RpoP